MIIQSSIFMFSDDHQWSNLDETRITQSEKQLNVFYKSIGCFKAHLNINDCDECELLKKSIAFLVKSFHFSTFWMSFH